MKQFILILLFIVCQFAGFSQSEPAVYSGSRDTPTVNHEQTELKVFPNPAKSGKVTLEMNTNEMAEIRLVNITGKEVLAKKFEFGENSYQLQLREIPNGIYLLQVKTIDNKSVVKKLLVANE